MPQLEDKRFRFENPVGGSVPNGATVSVGLSLDTWDWKLVDVDAKATDNSVFDFEVVVAFDWANNGGPLPPIPGDAPPDLDIIAPSPDGLGSRKYDLLAKGFQIVNNAIGPTVISGLAIAPTPDLKPTLDNLGSDMMDDLSRSGLLINIPIAPITLGPDEVFVFVLDGTTADLPADLLASGNFMLLSRPDLADEQLFVYTGTGTAAAPARVGNFTFVNTGLLVPTPAAPMLAALAGLLTLTRRRGRGHAWADRGV